MASEINDLHHLTKKIYLLILKGDKLSPLDIKNNLKLDSRSLAYYHLNKLYLMKLINKTPRGEYYINKEEIEKGIIYKFIDLLDSKITNLTILAFLSIFLALFTIILYINDVDKIYWLLLISPSFIIIGIMLLYFNNKWINLLKFIE